MLSIGSTSCVVGTARVPASVPRFVATRLKGPFPLTRAELTPLTQTLDSKHAVSPASSFDTINDRVLEAARDPSVSLLAQQVLEAEAEIKALFDSGRPMPSAAVVARKRQHIADMKDLLAAKLNVADTPSNPDASDDEAERARLLFLEVERSLQRQQRQQQPRDGPNPEYNFELALLEAENDQLRERAEALLKYQQQLEEVAEAHGLISFKDGQLVWTRRQIGAGVGAGAAAFQDQLEIAVSAASRAVPVA